MNSIESSGGYLPSFALTVVEIEDSDEHKYMCLDGNHRLTALRQVHCKTASSHLQYRHTASTAQLQDAGKWEPLGLPSKETPPEEAAVPCIVLR
jgi:hypothetical protein